MKNPRDRLCNFQNYIWPKISFLGNCVELVSEFLYDKQTLKQIDIAENGYNNLKCNRSAHPFSQVFKIFWTYYRPQGLCMKIILILKKKLHKEK